MKERRTSILMGIIIVILGVALLGRELGVWDITLFKGWWTLLLIVPGIISMISEGVKVSNTFITVVGLILLGDQMNLLPNVNIWSLVLASMIIILGFRLIFGSNKKQIKSNYENINRDYKKNTSSNDLNGRPSYFSILSGQDVRNVTDDLMAGEITTILGGIDADFSEAIVRRDITISCCCILGGIDIIAPKGVRVIVKGTQILGGYENKTPTIGDNNAPIVTINCFVLMGGIEIR
ncbi:MAG: LiaF transmembrane domain-containing protein [Clostridium sp.]